MKKVFLSLLVIILALGLLGAAGYAGYRFGFTQGMITASNAANGNRQSIGPGFQMNPRGMPMHNFGFTHDFDGDGLHRLQRVGMGFGPGLFPLFGLLLRLLFWGLIIAGIVWLITRSGWHLTRTAPATAAPAATTVVETPPATRTTTTVVETPPPDDENNPPA